MYNLIHGEVIMSLCHFRIPVQNLTRSQDDKSGQFYPWTAVCRALESRTVWQIMQRVQFAVNFLGWQAVKSLGWTILADRVSISAHGFQQPNSRLISVYWHSALQWLVQEMVDFQSTKGMPSNSLWLGVCFFWIYKAPDLRWSMFWPKFPPELNLSWNPAKMAAGNGKIR